MDELTVVQDFVSDDYFTSDSTKESFKAKALELRKEWEQESSDAEAEGRTLSTPLSAWSGARQKLQKRLVSLTEGLGEGKTWNDEDADEVVRFDYELLDLLGYSAGYDIVTGRNHDGTESSYQDVHGTATTEDSTPLLVVFATPVDDIAALLDKEASTLLRPIIQTLPGSTEKLERTDSVARYLSKRFVEDNPPSFALVLAGSTMLLTAAERWQEGRYLAIDLGLLFERNDTKRGGAVDQFLACTSAQALAPTAEGTTWFSGVLDDSVKHTEKVSEDLREAVQKSIEIIANEVVIRRRRENLDPLPADEAQVLAKQSLRFLYRILFLLFAEASPELDVVPVGSTEYESGYSLDRLRDLALVDIPTRRDGTHLYQSLNVLFTQIQSGHNDLRIAEAADRSHEAVPMSEGLVFHPLEADLFSRKATAHIDEVGLGNDALQQVLQKLLLSKESAKKARGFISYAELGINQLGRVYEGLMSYTGFFAETDLFEVAPKGDSSKGSWVVPTDRADHIDADDFVCEFAEASGEYAPVRHTKGSFVFRLSGRDRQQSASYYTPEVLTRFTVSQALAELLTDDMSADGILRLTVCEPALGSGAFALEAVNQLAVEYLRRKQDELGEAIDPATYQQELQKTKAYIALHNVYGVDLNSTAVELAEISLWLDTMVADLSAPWFGLRLRRGNSLIGARRSVYGRSTVKDKTWLKSTPQKVDSDERDGQSIYQFLLPAEGWGAAADAKEGKALAPEAVARLKTWRKSQRVKLSNPQIGRLVGLSKQADVLWEIALKRLTIAEAETRRTINVWGLEEPESGTTITRAEIEAKLADPNGAYQRLRRVMDAWCALWFWPLTETDIEPPSVEQWVDACEQMLGKPEGDVKSRSTSRVAGQASMFDVDNWSELNEYEGNQRAISGAASTVEKVLDEHPWLRITEAIAEQQGFFHWDLDFATVFQRGGFDLQLGNPPWVRPTVDIDALLAEGDPWWQLTLKPSETVRNRMRAKTLELPGIVDLVLDGIVDVAGTNEYLSAGNNYPALQGLQADLYRCFMEQVWRHSASAGVTGLIHPESHFTDSRAGYLRQQTYRRLRRHWQFINELKLFEIAHIFNFGVHVYGAFSEEIKFLNASNLYHPDTVDRSLKHDGSGADPGIKTPEDSWDLRPHKSRIVNVDNSKLNQWAVVLGEYESISAQTPLIYTVNSSADSVLAKLSLARRVGASGPQFSSGWHEKSDRQAGRFELQWGRPADWSNVIYQGPNLHVGTPVYKYPNPSMKSHGDWHNVDIEHLPGDAVPVTSYKPIRDGKYDQLYTHWTLPNGDRVAARDYYRIAWRAMAANTGERTLIPALIPPGVAHINGVFSYGFDSDHDLLLASGSMSSLLSDFAVRVAPKSGIYPAVTARLPLPNSDHPLAADVKVRVLLLNSLTDGYADLWNSLSDLTSDGQAWTGGYGYPDSVSMDVLDYEWSESSPLRLAADRRQAQVEIDALVALMLGVSADELCSIYRTQFPVLYKYDTQRDHFDQNGRIVPADVLKTWQKLGDAADEDDLSATNAQGFEYTYVPPFRTFDREADMRTAYAEFEQRLADKGESVREPSNSQGAVS
ncbi:class I SAM-dependent DNA methyltransferase [Brevibacterium sp. BDJS002]|uniref:Eco57I restriction-modification methylase domain-containing protein n=1 Tax=Brevibacterium sp. BDJS002 TaxID=3020906 RepID=UPI002307260F|nr:class I SAM-dependent DNA methyltransferase [Brevibacterium sp. BDJS002]WCE38799.1 class I SAM-dependent DNA methyltransferase [Brevibacterium sp. BDJS002]